MSVDIEDRETARFTHRGAADDVLGTRADAHLLAATMDLSATVAGGYPTLTVRVTNETGGLRDNPKAAGPG